MGGTWNDLKMVFYEISMEFEMESRSAGRDLEEILATSDTRFNVFVTKRLK